MLLFVLIFILCFVLTGLVLLFLARCTAADFLAATVSARSNHSTSARQLGGLAYIPVFMIAIALAIMAGFIPRQTGGGLISACLILWITGYLDDRNELSVPVRLLLQLVAAACALYGFGSHYRLLPAFLPYPVEYILLLIAILGSINISNFMDGLDWLTVSGAGIPLLLLGLIAAYFLQDDVISIIAFAVSGALAGFAIFNHPPARIFSGDSGSLPLGLISAFALLLFARQAGIIPALILPLYYIADASTTIVLRLRKGENILQAHSAHAYQIARRSGMSVYRITGSIALLNLSLGAIAAMVVNLQSTESHIAGLCLALLLTSLLLIYFRRSAHLPA